MNGLLEAVDHLNLHLSQFLDAFLLSDFLCSKIFLHSVVIVVNALNMFVLCFVCRSDCLLVSIVLVLGVDLIMIELPCVELSDGDVPLPVSYTHLRAHET